MLRRRALRIDSPAWRSPSSTKPTSCSTAGSRKWSDRSWVAPTRTVARRSASPRRYPSRSSSTSPRSCGPTASSSTPARRRPRWPSRTRRRRACQSLWRFCHPTRRASAPCCTTSPTRWRRTQVGTRWSSFSRRPNSRNSRPRASAAPSSPLRAVPCLCWRSTPSCPRTSATAPPTTSAPRKLRCCARRTSLRGAWITRMSPSSSSAKPPPPARPTSTASAARAARARPAAACCCSMALKSRLWQNSRKQRRASAAPSRTSQRTWQQSSHRTRRFSPRSVPPLQTSTTLWRLRRATRSCLTLRSARSSPASQRRSSCFRPTRSPSASSAEASRHLSAKALQSL
mmetsp:Transcript_15846/g.53399  ORF Transcript_15846/g.53399 Transcript_15846/m.53399 type:complete len:343 (+) Transcript_15846:607-1635(+)